MDRLSLLIAFPSLKRKKFHIFTPNLIVISLWALVILLLWGFNSAIPVGGAARWWLLAIVFVVTMAFLIRSFFTYAPLKGTMDGKIIFNEDNIEVRGKHTYKM